MLMSDSEGESFRYPWRWNETIGPLTQRPGRPGTWGYATTDGLGLVEYLNWCVDLDMEPVLTVWSGMHVDPPNNIPTPAELAPWENDTLNELEFIMGDTSTPYGALRASLGYPKPWNLKYVEIGNEDYLNGGTASYAEYLFDMFYNAIFTAYPSLTIISSLKDPSAVGPGSALDYHIYTRPDFFVSEFGYFDNANRSHKILVAEYASLQYNLFGCINGTSPFEPRMVNSFWAGAVSEAVWSFRMERNGDVTI